nr:hypothetical protein [Tanacetum cinerariifolium]
DEKIEKVKIWKTPTTVKDVQEFLGFANFHRNFVKDFSARARPLTELTKKDVEFQWGKEQEEA